MRGAPHVLCSLRVPSSVRSVQLRGAGAQPRGLRRRSPFPGPSQPAWPLYDGSRPEALWPEARAQGRPPPRTCTPRAPAQSPITQPAVPASPASASCAAQGWEGVCGVELTWSER